MEVSDNGQTFRLVASEDYPVMSVSDRNGAYNHKLSFDPIKARYVKVCARPERRIPDWHGGKGILGFLFVNEIVLN